MPGGWRCWGRGRVARGCWTLRCLVVGAKARSIGYQYKVLV